MNPNAVTSSAITKPATTHSFAVELRFKSIAGSSAPSAKMNPVNSPPMCAALSMRGTVNPMINVSTTTCIIELIIEL